MSFNNYTNVLRKMLQMLHEMQTCEF